MKTRTALRLYYAGRIVLFVVIALVCMKPALSYLAEFNKYMHESCEGFFGSQGGTRG